MYIYYNLCFGWKTPLLFFKIFFKKLPSVSAQLPTTPAPYVYPRSFLPFGNFLIWAHYSLFTVVQSDSCEPNNSKSKHVTLNDLDNDTYKDDEYLYILYLEMVFASKCSV